MTCFGLFLTCGRKDRGTGVNAVTVQTQMWKAHKAMPSAERTRVYRLKNAMLLLVNVGSSFACRTSPCQKHNSMRSDLSHGIDNLLSESFPALLCVTICIMGPNCQTGIEQ